MPLTAFPAARRGRPGVCLVDAGRMHAECCRFCSSANEVRLTKAVLVQYLSKK